MTAAARRIQPLAALSALAAFAVLIGLGVWQVERIHWKEAILARLEARLSAAPAPLPPPAQWPGLAGRDFEYTRVFTSGVFEHSRETLIYRGSGKAAGAPAQPGYWVMTPLRLADGAHVLINRGFIALDRKDAARGSGRDTGETVIRGLLRAPEPRGAFTPADNPAKGEWFTRDPVAIAAAIGLERAAPFSIDEEAHAAPQGSPAGGATVVDIPNNHLSYALTWFALAATLAALCLFAALRRRDGQTPRAPLN